MTAFDFAHSDHQKVRLEPEDFWLTPGYFSEVLTEVNTLFRLEPRPLTAAMIASAIPAAIRPYSMAVAPIHPAGSGQRGWSFVTPVSESRKVKPSCCDAVNSTDQMPT